MSRTLQRTLTGLALGLALMAAGTGAARAFTVTGTVRNESGTALGNVDLDFVELCSGANLFLAGDKTAADGAYSVIVPAGTYDVHFTPPAGSTVAAGDLHDVVVSGDVALGLLTLPAGRLVSGTVLTPSLAAAAGVDLKFVDVTTQHRRYLGKDATTAAGLWSVRVPPGTYDIDFRPGAASVLADAERLGLVVGGVDVTGLRDTLRSGFTITGAVRDKRNNKVVNLDVDVFDVCTGRRLATAHDNTDVNGNYSIVVPAGTYTFNYDPPACLALEASRSTGTVVDRDRNLGTEQLKDAVLVSGSVLDHSGLPLAGVKVKFYDVTAAGAPRQPSTRDRTDAAGHFAIYVQTSTYDLNFEPPAGVQEQVGHLDGVVVGGAISIGAVQLLAGVPVSGHVAGPGNVPVTNVNINVVDSRTRVAQRLAHDDTDAAGNFTVVLAPGTYDIQYDSPDCTGLAPGSQDLVQVVGAATLPAMALVTGVRVQGTVLNDTSLAVPSADLDFYPAGSGSKIYTPNDRTAVDGTYNLLVPPGTYDVKFIPSSLTRLRPAARFVVPLTVSQALPVTTLASGWIVSGAVRDSLSLAPIAAVAVEFWPPGGAAPAWTPHHDTSLLGVYGVAVDAGTWDLRYLPPPGAPYPPTWRRGVVVAADTPLPDLLLLAQPLPVPARQSSAALSLGAWPNPTRGGIRFALSGAPGPVELSVWDAAGRRVTTLYRGPGDVARTVSWDGAREGGAGLAAGVYFARLSTGDGRSLTRRVIRTD